MYNIPNMLTMLRILLIPVVVAVFYMPFSNSYFWCFVIFVFAALTDWLDGYLARKLDMTSTLGALLDPLADKLMVAVVLVLLVDKFDSPWVTIPAAIIVMREILVSGLREWMAELGQRAAVKVSWIGKSKTAFQMIGLALLILFNGSVGEVFHGRGLNYHGEYLFSALGLVLLLIATILTVWSMVKYLIAAWPYFK